VISTHPLPKRLGLREATALVISNVVGTGIFTVPGIVAAMVPSAPAILALWAAGGALALCGALSYGALATRYPRAGGEYVYLREGISPVAGFLSGWTSFIAGFSGAVAAGAMAVAAYVGFDLRDFRGRALACVIVVAFAALHSFRLTLGAKVQSVVTILNVGLFVLLCIGGLLTSATPVVGVAGTFTVSTLLVALVPIMFTYSGWNAAAYVSEEVREPEKNVRRSLLIGTGIVIVLYLLVNVVYVLKVGIGADTRIDIASLIGQRTFGAVGARVVQVFSIVIIAASVSAMTIAGPRVYFAMARDRCFPRWIVSLDPKTQVPHAAIWLQALWSCLLVLSGTFEEVLLYTGFAVVLFSMAAVATLVWTRGAASTGVLAAAVAFTIAGVGMLTSVIIHAPKPSLIGAALIAAGLPIYFWSRRQAAA
jgi:APA family basic amino acid/polyamine antiporter